MGIYTIRPNTGGWRKRIGRSVNPVNPVELPAAVTQQSKRGEEPPQLFMLELLMPYHKIIIAFTGNLIEPVSIRRMFTTW
jgi:hypothetical protein